MTKPEMTRPAEHDFFAHDASQMPQGPTTAVGPAPPRPAPQACETTDG